MFSYMQFLSFNFSLLFALYEMKSRIYKAKSGDAPQVTWMTARKATGIILGDLYRGLWPWQSHMWTRPVYLWDKDISGHSGTRAAAWWQLRPKAVKPELGNENGKEGSRVSGIMRKNWLQDQPGEQQLLPKNPECQRMKDGFEGERLAHLALVNFLPSQKDNEEAKPSFLW